MAIKLTKELLSTEPEDLAKEIAGKVTSSQIRKFYNDFLILKTKSEFLKTEEDFQRDVLPLICFSKAKIAYALGRSSVQISKRFADKINCMVDAIETRSDFENFLNFYQALIGYVTFYAKKLEEEKQNSRNQNMNKGLKNFPQNQPKVYVERRGNKY